MNLTDLKKATVAIGLAQRGKTSPEIIFGTGFIVNPEGYVITAHHVIEKCREYQRDLLSKHKKTELVVVRTIFDGEFLNFEMMFSKKCKILRIFKKGDSGPDTLIYLELGAAIICSLFTRIG